MAAINFPNSPSVDDIHSENNMRWRWTGTTWTPVGVTGSAGVVEHGAVASVSRPGGYSMIFWIGSVEPNNAINNDVWINTA